MKLHRCSWEIACSGGTFVYFTKWVPPPSSWFASVSYPGEVGLQTPFGVGPRISSGVGSSMCRTAARLAPGPHPGLAPKPRQGSVSKPCPGSVPGPRPEWVRRCVLPRRGWPLELVRGRFPDLIQSGFVDVSLLDEVGHRTPSGVRSQTSSGVGLRASSGVDPRTLSGVGSPMCHTSARLASGSRPGLVPRPRPRSVSEPRPEWVRRYPRQCCFQLPSSKPH